MNIFITGGTGFIGKHLVDSLSKNGDRIFILTRNKKKVEEWKNDNIIPIEGDIQKPESFSNVFEKDIDIIYHLAAIPGQKWSFKEEDYFKINAQGTKKLLDASRGKVKKFIFCSSINAIKNAAGFHDDPYGKSKFEAEELVRSEKDIETAILRPAIVYGPLDIGGMFLKMCRMIKNGRFIMIGSGQNILPIIYIDDLIDAFLKARSVAGSRQACEIVSSEEMSFQEIADTIAEILQVKKPRIHLPVSFARIAARISETFFSFLCLEPVLTSHRVDIMTKSKPLDQEKAKKELAFYPKTSFEEGIKITIDWYKKNGYL